MHRMTDEDRDFLEGFESLPREEWTHEARVRMAYLILRCDDFASAIGRMRRGILRFNSRNGVSNTSSRGYHETLTLAWARVIASASASAPPDADFATFIASHPDLLRKERILRHYSRERILSARARREFVLPDRDPLPVAPAREASTEQPEALAGDVSSHMTGSLIAASYG